LTLLIFNIGFKFSIYFFFNFLFQEIQENKLKKTK